MHGSAPPPRRFLSSEAATLAPVCCTCSCRKIARANWRRASAGRVGLSRRSDRARDDHRTERAFLSRYRPPPPRRLPLPPPREKYVRKRAQWKFHPIAGICRLSGLRLDPRFEAEAPVASGARPGLRLFWATLLIDL